jgi:hypothetical protein
MEARTAFRGSSVSKRWLAVVVAILAGVLLAGAVGYVVNARTLTTATMSSDQRQYSSLSDTPTRSLRGGPQTMDGPAYSGSTGSKFQPRHNGVQLP